MKLFFNTKKDSNHLNELQQNSLISNTVCPLCQISFDTTPYNDPEGFNITRKKTQGVNLLEREKQIVEKQKSNEKE